jgi:membrane-bound lytic murein transglycosylase D
MVRIASLLVSGMLWYTASVASPMVSQQNPALNPQGGVKKDTLIASNKASTTDLNAYGFKTLLSANDASRLEASVRSTSTVSSSAHSLNYSAEVHNQAPGLVSKYLRSEKETLTGMKSWGARSFNIIDRVMAQYGLPHELRYLAVIESELHSTAYSNVGARGVWQFMPETARLYGLKVNKKVDERMDLEKSTRAAARYLQDMYDELHDWLLVIAAYDGGTNRIHVAIRKSGSTNFFDLQNYLPLESRNEVKRFIATNFFMEDVPALGDLNATSAKELEEILTPQELQSSVVETISGHYTAEAITKHLSMSMADFLRLNPNFNGTSGSQDFYNLRLPKDKMTLFLQDKDLILGESVHGLLNSEDDEEPKHK